MFPGFADKGDDIIFYQIRNMHITHQSLAVEDVIAIGYLLDGIQRI